MFVEVFLVCASILLLIGFLKGKWNERYWNKRGIKFHLRNKLFGPFWDFVTQDRALLEIFRDIHREYKDEGVVGIGSTLAPMLFVIDPQIVQHVFQTDFHSFNHRGVEAQPGDKLADNVSFMYGNRWKLVRQNLTPLFTSAKLKNMYYIMDKSARDFIYYLENDFDKCNDNIFDTISTFCSAAIGASVFGITTESVFNSPFLKMARKALASNFISDLRFSLLFVNPWLFRKLGLALFGDYENFFINAMKHTIRKRKDDCGKKHDFIDMCVNLQKYGQLKDLETGLILEPTDELLAAQGFFFFIAGVEPSANSLYCTSLELGLNPHILNRLHEDIDEAFEKYKGQMSFDIINNMNYMDMVLNEALRKYPPIGLLMRQCVQDTVLPVTNIKISKGTRILVSTYEFHHDPERYPEPEKFIPERFESKDSHELYMPFGKGNRSCVGERYARVQVKTGLIYVLRYYTIKTVVNGDKIKFHKKQFQVFPSNARVTFVKRENITRY